MTETHWQFPSQKSFGLKVFHLFCVQVRYKAAGKVKNCEYPRLPDTLETQHAKEAAELHSQVQNAAASPGDF